MARYKLTIEYDGTPFVGWQRQPNGLAVQQVLEEAAARITGVETLVQGAGRTDAGVHALGQVAHFDCEKDLTGNKMREALNFHVKPHPIAILDCEIVDDEFHARFSAIARHYVYRILNRRPPPAIDKGTVWHVPNRLDEKLMHEGAQYFVGHHDFTTFRSVQCQAKSPVKTLTAISVSRYDDELEVRVSAPSFLHNQVRSIVGTLKMVGEGKWPPLRVKQAIEAADRAACGPVAPPDGLYLDRVDYPVQD